MVVGYAMKASREADLAKEGLLNLVPQVGPRTCRARRTAMGVGQGKELVMRPSNILRSVLEMFLPGVQAVTPGLSELCVHVSCVLPHMRVQDGVVFAPLDLSQPLESQLPFHCILHKASDELEYGPPSPPAAAAAAGESAVPTAGRGVGGEGAASASSTGDDGGASGGGAGLLVPRFGPRVRAMAEFVSQQGGRVSLLDPLQSTAKVIRGALMMVGTICNR